MVVAVAAVVAMHIHLSSIAHQASQALEPCDLAPLGACHRC